jgi:hypothetical protein
MILIYLTNESIEIEIEKVGWWFINFLYIFHLNWMKSRLNSKVIYYFFVSKVKY